MKYSTMWWGLQILAETNEDKIILLGLIDKLPDKPTHDYEEGSIKVIYPKDLQDTYAAGDGFTRDEVLKGKLLIEFNR